MKCYVLRRYLSITPGGYTPLKCIWVNVNLFFINLFASMSTRQHFVGLVNFFLLRQWCTVHNNAYHVREHVSADPSLQNEKVSLLVSLKSADSNEYVSCAYIHIYAHGTTLYMFSCLTSGFASKKDSSDKR